MTVADRQQVTGIDVALVPGGVIVGRVLDEDGTPFAGAVVDALVTRSEMGTDTLASVSTSQTDDHGDFRLYGLNPGQYDVSAADPAFRNVSTPERACSITPPRTIPVCRTRTRRAPSALRRRATRPGLSSNSSSCRPRGSAGSWWPTTCGSF